MVCSPRRSRLVRRLWFLLWIVASSSLWVSVVFAATAAEPRSTGPLRPPVAGVPVVATPFQAPVHRYGAGHRGVDLKAAVDASLVAPADGTVVFAGRLVDRGVVSVEHAGGVRSSMEPVRAAVVAGQRVAAGQLLGALEAGHPRCQPQACVHWGVRINGVYIDPMLLLRPLRVRLLPWDG